MYFNYAEYCFQKNVISRQVKILRFLSQGSNTGDIITLQSSVSVDY